MKLPSIQNRFLTPAVSPDLVAKKQQTLSQKQSALGTGGGSGKSSPTFEQYLAQMNAYYAPETIDYTPLSRDVLTELIADSLRPVYDKAIASRQERTQAYNANLDADAWARGMGSSSYLSDIKSRSYRDEARDIGSLESSYGETLAQRLFSALEKQAEQKLEVDMFNAGQINPARSRAFDAATKLYAASRSSSGSGSKKTTVSANQPSVSMRTELRSSLTDAPVYDTIAVSAPEVVQQVIARMTPSERADLYAANTPSTARMMNEMVKSVGSRKMKELMFDYPAQN